MLQGINLNNVIERIRDSRDALYGLKHHVESGMRLQGIWQCDQYRDGELIAGGQPEEPNTFTTVGMAFLHQTFFWTTSKAASRIWYIYIFKNNVTPAVGDTAAKLGNGNTFGECQDADYDSPATNRPAYTTATTATATVTNSANKAEYTMAASITVYGAGLVNDAPKTSVSGILLCGKKFGTARAVIDNDVLSVTYAVTTSNP